MVLSDLPRVELPAEVDTLLWDGETVAQVVSIDDLGRYVLEDLHTETVRDKHDRLQVVELTFPVAADALLRGWRVLRLPTELRPEEILPDAA